MAAALRAAVPTLSDKLKYAIKVGLSMTLAYMIPMGMGWSQPSTAAITVMLIAATGTVSESLAKGTLRIIGTLIGAAIGLFLIIVFPQDRELYLLAVSIIISVMFFLYKSFRGDGTVFMLAAVMVLMVFNGGNIADSFMYGIDRTWMTVFGVAVYSLVGTFLWPVNVKHDCAGQAQQLTTLSADLFRNFVSSSTAGNTDARELIANIVQAQAGLQTAFEKARSNSEQMTYADKEWRAALFSYKQLTRSLAAGVTSQDDIRLVYPRFISNYKTLTDDIENLFDGIAKGWAGESIDVRSSNIEPSYHKEALATLGHLQVASILARGQALEDIRTLLMKLHRYAQYINAEGDPVADDGSVPAQARFVWLDTENFKTAIKVFLTFWIAAGTWIYFNPPGGFMLVAIATLLVPLLSFTPLHPKQLVMLFTLCFFFAIPSYVFILPHLTIGYELALFLFLYTFTAYYFFGGPLSIFFLLGMFTFGISNTMQYHFGVFLSIILMFYLAIVTLAFTHYFPFTPRAEKLLLTMKRRFFRSAGKFLTASYEEGWLARITQKVHWVIMSLTVAKIRTWMRLIDQRLFAENSPETLTRFADRCALFHFRLTALVDTEPQVAGNAIIQEAKSLSSGEPYLSSIADLRTQDDPAEPEISEDAVEQRLKEFIDSLDIDAHKTDDVGGFYTWLNVHREFARELGECCRTVRSINWADLRGARF